MPEKPKLYGRAAYDPVNAAVSDLKLAHAEIVAALEWLERGHLGVAVDRVHLAYRFLEETLVREKRVEAAEED